MSHRRDTRRADLPTSSKARGFTLIELLVVIAIIAILAAILFPVFARARENARRSSCQSNEKNIALGFKQYLQDYDEKYPAKDSWKTAIHTYTKSDQILRCPSAGNTAATDFSQIDYLYNTNLDTKKESLIEDSALTVLNAEATRGAMTSGTKASAGTRHFDGSNYSFVDGHVKWLKPAAVIAAASTTQATFYAPITTAAQAAINEALGKYGFTNGDGVLTFKGIAVSSNYYNSVQFTGNLSTDENAPTMIPDSGASSHWTFLVFDNTGPPATGVNVTIDFKGGWNFAGNCSNCGQDNVTPEDKAFPTGTGDTSNPRNGPFAQWSVHNGPHSGIGSAPPEYHVSNWQHTPAKHTITVSFGGKTQKYYVTHAGN